MKLNDVGKQGMRKAAEGRPFTGAWIETQCTMYTTHGPCDVAPSRGRGLKRQYSRIVCRKQ